MRPALVFICLFVFLVTVNGLFLHQLNNNKSNGLAMNQMYEIADLTGLADPAFTTEARYTRHPGITDSTVPFMDHPGALEHFPSSAMFSPHGVK